MAQNALTSTMFRTPIISPVLGFFARIILKLIGWRIEGEKPVYKKYILLAAPHTSNWDFAIFLLVAFSLRIDIHWMGKDALFPKPFKWLMIWLGGVPVDRSKSNNMVDQMSDYYRDSEELIVIVPPEGTRRKVDRWKTGFYHIARQAELPIVQGYFDADRKCVGFGPSFFPTGDVDKDIAEIRAFYADKSGIIKANQ
jgi:1-acyl-sn-glycerol-3-phosphate acyltransferase